MLLKFKLCVMHRIISNVICLGVGEGYHNNVTHLPEQLGQPPHTITIAVFVLHTTTSFML